MSETFGRTYRLLAVRQPDNAKYFDELGNAIEITQQRVTFSIEKNLTAKPNTGEIKIYNLWEDHRALFDERPQRVYFEAGHAGANRLLFVGDMRPGSGSEKDGTEWITTLKLGDGARAFSEARVNRSYKLGTPMLTVLKDAARSMHLALPAELISNSELAQMSVSGEVLDGYTSDELTRLLGNYGYSWSIQNGKLQVLRDEQVIAGTERIIAQSTGMLDHPKMKFPVPTKAKKSKKPRKRPSVEIKHVLDGTLVPGMRIQLRAAVLDGAFKLTKTKHTGDLWGAEWQTEMEGIPVV